MHWKSISCLALIVACLVLEGCGSTGLRTDIATPVDVRSAPDPITEETPAYDDGASSRTELDSAKNTGYADGKAWAEEYFRAHKDEALIMIMKSVPKDFGGYKKVDQQWKYADGYKQGFNEAADKEKLVREQLMKEREAGPGQM